MSTETPSYTKHIESRRGYSEKPLKQVNYQNGVIESTSFRFDLYQKTGQSTPMIGPISYREQGKQWMDSLGYMYGGKGVHQSGLKPSPIPPTKLGNSPVTTQIYAETPSIPYIKHDPFQANNTNF